LEDLLNVLGDRRVSLVREISKIYEQVMLTTVSEAIEYYKETEPKGEFVIIVEGSSEEKNEVSDEIIEKEFYELVNGGMAKTFAAKALARKYNLSKREIYERFKDEN
jgi:16S rRNA (cytidine1402-2'-O)-methyltransferase